MQSPRIFRGVKPVHCCRLYRNRISARNNTLCHVSLGVRFTILLCGQETVLFHPPLRVAPIHKVTHCHWKSVVFWKLCHLRDLFVHCSAEALGDAVCLRTADQREAGPDAQVFHWVHAMRQRVTMPPDKASTARRSRGCSAWIHISCRLGGSVWLGPPLRSGHSFSASRLLLLHLLRHDVVISPVFRSVGG